MTEHNDISKTAISPINKEEHIESFIQNIRGCQVLLDRDLAALYGVETRRLNEQVQRNIERFPSDFMFQLTKEEFENWKSQFATSNSVKMGYRKLPYAFTENGVAMLSSVLRSPQAIATNILIMRAFTAMRHFLASNAQIFQRMEIMERNQLAMNAHLADTDRKIENVFKRLDSETVQPQYGIFYDGEVFDAYVFIADKIKEAESRIVLFDNYVDESVLSLLDKRKSGVTATIYTKTIDAHLKTDIARHDARYPHIEVRLFTKSHDRFLCIDDTVYFVGASIKDLGKRWFAFGKMEQTTDELLAKM
ncbi:MAG: ORF6N domain-containing protein [Paludibacteraceae bacterium]